MSDFIVELTGRLTLPEAEIEKQKHLPESERIVEDAREIIYPGKNAEGWWNAAQLIKQVIYRHSFITLNLTPDRLSRPFRYSKSCILVQLASFFLTNPLPMPPLVRML